ncbi:hypothetical protein PIIN_10308 [Serendipita indica DSM 11827]|uniref:Uncharacterized protein n=1 Tax=Serendipita indica (strain DSM 11827) TaxID=1109443 RepID=G4TYC0_SERID|nr:hypothetical protein PIIN_10308 [Serendipita indica DSM 11827]
MNAWSMRSRPDYAEMAQKKGVRGLSRLFRFAASRRAQFPSRASRPSSVIVSTRLFDRFLSDFWSL